VKDREQEIESRALDAFLAPGADDERLLAPDESAERFRTYFAPPEALLDDPELHPRRVVLLWRWARAFCHSVGVLEEDETLEEALETLDDPWYGGVRPRPTPRERALLRLDGTSALYRACSEPGGLPILPPGDDRDGRWVDAFAAVSSDLRLRSAGPRAAEALRPLLDARYAAKVGVTVEQILSLEELAVDEAQRIVLRSGERAAVDHFRERYGLSRREGLGLVRLARADVVLYGRTSIEEDRALMVAQLRDLLDRVRRTMNTAEETRILKELARVQGLTRLEPEDAGSEFLGIVRTVAARQDALPLAPGAYDAEEENDEEGGPRRLGAG